MCGAARRRNLKLVVTGSSGQIGSYVVEHARGRGIDVRGLDLRPAKTTTHVGDVRSRADCADAIAGAEAVVHCAAQVSVQASLADPALDAEHNLLGTIRALEAARIAGCRTFVYFSSAAVYGEPVRLPLDESVSLAPLSPYGASKAAGERYVEMYRRAHGMRVRILRPFNVASPRQAPDNPYAGVFVRFAQCIRDGGHLTVYGDGSQTRDFVHAADVASWVVDVGVLSEEVPSAVTVNLGTGRETSIIDLAHAFCDSAGTGVSAIHHAPPRPGEIHRSVADATKARALGFLPVRDVEDIVREVLTVYVGPPRAEL